LGYRDFWGQGPQVLEPSVKYSSDHPTTMHGQKAGHPKDFQEAERPFWGMQNYLAELCNGTQQCSMSLSLLEAIPHILHDVMHQPTPDLTS